MVHINENSTPADFERPLLEALAGLSGNTPNQGVKITAVLPVVMANLGIDGEEAFGFQGTVPKVRYWVQSANKSTRRKGWTVNVQRGTWSLTLAGLAELGLAPNLDQYEVKMEKAPTSTDSYHEDPYIRNLAILNTSCFGSYSGHANAICGKCPLREACYNATMATYAALAAKLEAEDAAEAAKAAMAPESVSEDVVVEDTAPSFSGVRKLPKGDVITCRRESICSGCGDPIKVGDKALWIDDLPETGDGAVFHMHCAEVEK